jgi:hypothetical protein
MSDDCCFVEPIEVVIVAEPLDVVVVATEPVEAEIVIGGQTTINNTGSPDYAREEYIVALAGPATIYLDRVPNQITGIYINGLLLESTKYELLGASVLMLSTANLLPSDQITIIYY